VADLSAVAIIAPLHGKWLPRTGESSNKRWWRRTVQNMRNAALSINMKQQFIILMLLQLRDKQCDRDDRRVWLID